ncbi:hypothetical protein AC1031_004255 [Aphanomyces cochlioides]|nr:hypothetical protein AC1031_004255 [Aphanomyces cochlioides]
MSLKRLGFDRAAIKDHRNRQRPELSLLAVRITLVMIKLMWSTWRRKEQIWGNKEYALSYERSETIKDYVFADVNQAEKYEAFQLFGHKDKSHTVAYVYFGEALCGGKGVGVYYISIDVMRYLLNGLLVHGGCIATIFDELLGMTFVWYCGHSSDKYV